MSPDRRRWILLWLLLTLLVVGVGVTVFLGQQTVPHAPTEPPAVATDSHRVPLLVIATNEVLDAVLERVSDTVRRLELPLDTPLVPARVLRFETKPVLAGRPSSLRSEVKYDGGYEFRHQDGIVYELRTPHSRREQVSQETGSNQGRVKGESFKEGMELAGPILRRALRRLDYQDVSVIGDNPMVMRWFDWIDPSPEHWFLAFSHPVGGGTVATTEIDAVTHAIHHLWLAVSVFGREPWPNTLTHGSLLLAERSVVAASMDWSELNVDGLDREYAAALIRAVLPEAVDFCRRVGYGFPSQIVEADLDLRECTAGMLRGRVWLRLKLRSGHMAFYHRGHVCGVAAPDVSENRPEEDGVFRASAEYQNPLQIEESDAIARVQRVALRNFGLPVKELGLDTAPGVGPTFRAGATNGLRRYIIGWLLPTTEEKRDGHMENRYVPQNSVHGEVDAVSGSLKRFGFSPDLFDVPDPVRPMSGTTSASRFGNAK